MSLADQQVIRGPHVVGGPVAGDGARLAIFALVEDGSGVSDKMLRHRALFRDLDIAPARPLLVPERARAGRVGIVSVASTIAQDARNQPEYHRAVVVPESYWLGTSWVLTF